MGRRSRKRMAEGAPAPGGSTRAERDEARRQRVEGAQTRRSYARGRPSIDDRPPAPWGSFPLAELAVLVSIVLLIASFIVRGDQGGGHVRGRAPPGRPRGPRGVDPRALRRLQVAFDPARRAAVAITVIALAAEGVLPLLLAAGLGVRHRLLVVPRGFRRRSAASASAERALPHRDGAEPRAVGGVPFGGCGWAQVQARRTRRAALLAMAARLASRATAAGWLNLQHIHARERRGSRPTATSRSRASWP